jgi:hypothetical protein
MACDAKHARALETLARGALARDDWRALRAHVRECAACRGSYDRAVLAARLLEGGAARLHLPARMELALIEEAVLEVAAPERSRGQIVGAWIRNFFAAPRRWVPVAAAAVAIGVVTPVALRLLDESAGPERVRPPQAGSLLSGADHEFQARGDVAAPRPAGVLRVFCLSGPQVRALEPGGACGANDRMRFTFLNVGRFRHLFLVGVDGAGALKWYAPRPPLAASIDAPALASGHAPVGPTFRVGVNHRAGAIRVFAIVSDSPVSSAEVSVAARSWHADQARGVDGPTLPLSRRDVAQTSILWRAVP